MATLYWLDGYSFTVGVRFWVGMSLPGLPGIDYLRIVYRNYKGEGLSRVMPCSEDLAQARLFSIRSIVPIYHLSVWRKIPLDLNKKILTIQFFCKMVKTSIFLWKLEFNEAL